MLPLLLFSTCWTSLRSLKVWLSNKIVKSIRYANLILFLVDDRQRDQGRRTCRCFRCYSSQHVEHLSVHLRFDCPTSLRVRNRLRTQDSWHQTRGSSWTFHGGNLPVPCVGKSYFSRVNDEILNTIHGTTFIPRNGRTLWRPFWNFKYISRIENSPISTAMEVTI